MISNSCSFFLVSSSNQLFKAASAWLVTCMSVSLVKTTGTLCFLFSSEALSSLSFSLKSFSSSAARLSSPTSASDDSLFSACALPSFACTCSSGGFLAIRFGIFLGFGRLTSSITGSCTISCLTSACDSHAFVSAPSINAILGASDTCRSFVFDSSARGVGATSILQTSLRRSSSSSSSLADKSTACSKQTPFSGVVAADSLESIPFEEASSSFKPVSFSGVVVADSLKPAPSEDVCTSFKLASFSGATVATSTKFISSGAFTLHSRMSSFSQSFCAGRTSETTEELFSTSDGPGSLEVAAGSVFSCAFLQIKKTNSLSVFFLR
mmetsp:Transcript_87536/g.137081  ORF Transcript_87536/g.137081 Transcript_87536/m.137081 type:complete len:324 (-) Transcript_87536:568-1539(-)